MASTKLSLVIVLLASCLALCSSEQPESPLSPPEQQRIDLASVHPAEITDNKTPARTSSEQPENPVFPPEQAEGERLNVKPAEVVDNDMADLYKKPRLPNDREDEPSKSPPETPKVPPTLMSFQEFKTTFGRHYDSILEELRRQKLFLARYLRSKLSWLKYWIEEKTSYLGINRMSDWTEEERATTKNKVLSGEESTNRVHLRKSGGAVGGAKKTADEVNSAGGKDETAGHVNPGEHKDKTVGVVIFGGEKDEPRGLKALLAAGQSSSRRSQSDDDRDSDSEIVSYDLRTTKCFNEPIHQGQCGSCYAIATVTMYEYIYCTLHDGHLVKFSEQYIIDCGDNRITGLDMKGCEGGDVTSSAKFVDQMGLEQSRDYPYLARDGDQCPYLSPDNQTLDKEAAGVLKFHDSALVEVQKEEFEDYLRNNVPLYLIIMVAEGSFYDYGGGVDPGEDCENGNRHVVLLIGSGFQDGREYWLLRNSFGSDWGEAGYYKLDKQSKCLTNGTGYTLDAFNHPSEEAFEANESHQGVPGRKSVNLTPGYDGKGWFGSSSKKKKSSGNDNGNEDYVGMVHSTSYDDEPGPRGPAAINPAHQHYQQYIDRDYMNRMNEYTSNYFHYSQDDAKQPEYPKVVQPEYDFQQYDFQNGRFDLFSNLPNTG